MSEPSLEELMVKTQGGCQRSYQRLLEESSRLARVYVSRRLSNQSEVEDIVQEVLLAIHKAKHTYHPDRPYKPWLYALVHYKLSDYLRSAYRRGKTGSLDDAVLNTVADETVTFGDLVSEQIDDAFAELNERQKALLIKTKLEGKSIRETAAELGMSESAVKVGVHRAIDKLKKIFGDEGAK